MPSQPTELFVLIETAAGFFLVHVNEWEGIGQQLDAVQESLLEAQKFSQMVTVKAVYQFKTAEEALNNCAGIVAGEVTDVLRNFLEQNLPKKKKKYQLGVVDAALGKSLTQLDYPVLYDKGVLEIARLCRFHMKKLMKSLGDTDLMKFQVGLGHAYSRSKISMDPNRQDKPVQNAVALLENLDKMINTFAMRVKEWYSWHFPELGVIITDNIKFAKAAKVIGVKETFEEDRFQELVDVLDNDEEMARSIMNAKNASMGQEIVEADIVNIAKFADHVIALAEQRKNLSGYLGGKLECVAPNLQSLVGDVLAAKLIAHAGSLTNLAKCPASTIQILGAEKALFRALKTKGKTPKYGLLFQSTFIGRAAPKNKGRISRYVANKCSLAARIDNFASTPCNVFGEKMREQVENRMRYLSEGVATKKNIDVMKEAMEEYDEKVAQLEGKNEEEKAHKKKKRSKSKVDATSDRKTEGDVSMIASARVKGAQEDATQDVTGTEGKRSKKRKRDREEAEAEPVKQVEKRKKVDDDEPSKKSKKKKKASREKNENA